MAHIGQSRPDAGLGVQGKALTFLKLFPLRSAATIKQVTSLDVTGNDLEEAGDVERLLGGQVLLE